MDERTQEIPALQAHGRERRWLLPLAFLSLLILLVPSGADAAVTSSSTFTANFSCPGGVPTDSGTIQGYY